MDENVQAAGRQIGVTEKDVDALQRRRLIKAALFGAVPVIAFFVGYFLRKVLQQETSSELPASTYPYAAAAALIRPMGANGADYAPKKYTVVGVLCFAIVAFIVGYFIPDITVEGDQTTPRYGVFSR